METLDETDLQILKTLQKNAKLTTKELADAVHLTPTPFLNAKNGSSGKVTSRSMLLCSTPRS